MAYSPTIGEGIARRSARALLGIIVLQRRCRELIEKSGPEGTSPKAAGAPKEKQIHLAGEQSLGWRFGVQRTRRGKDPQERLRGSSSQAPEGSGVGG